MRLQPRPQVIQPQDPSYRLIALTRGQVCKVDTADYEWMMKWNWSASFSPHTRSFYAARGSFGRNIKMHRVLMGEPPTNVDHANLDTLDNRRVNLRCANKQQNGFNKNKQTNNTSGFKGVSRASRGGGWQAQIRIDGKLKHLGTFKSPEEASDKYRQEVISVAGDFARY